MTSPPTSKRPPGRPRIHSVEEQRETILRAARTVFAEQDFHGTTIERVAREAGVARPAVYELFGGKDELFVAVVEDCAMRLALSMEQRRELHRDLPVTAVVRANVAAVFDFIADQPDVAAIIRIAEYGGFGPAKSEVLRVRRTIEDAVATLFASRWEPVGMISPESARLLALMMLAMVEAVGFRQPEEPWAAEATIDFMAQFIFGGLVHLNVRGDLIRSFGDPDRTEPIE